MTSCTMSVLYLANFGQRKVVEAGVTSLSHVADQCTLANFRSQKLISLSQIAKVGTVLQNMASSSFANSVCYAVRWEQLHALYSTRDHL